MSQEKFKKYDIYDFSNAAKIIKIFDGLRQQR